MTKMNQTFNEITEQIKNEEIKFPYSDTLFEEYSPKNIDQLIYIAVENYTYSTIEEFDGYVNDIAYRTVGYLTRNLILPNKLIELYLNKYKTINNLDNYEDINANDFINCMSESLELSRDFIRINLRFLDVIE